MQCSRCHNQNTEYMYQYKGEWYCRKCINFSRVKLNEERITRHGLYKPSYVQYKLDFNLSKRQLEISSQLKKNYQEGKNSYVWAVCGSGKTEIVFEVIQYALNMGQRVCFCIPRKELVKELYQRIKDCFSNVEIGVLYGGCEVKREAQFIICTMHQLYKFENGIGFDLMISDEVDAFPFYQNDVLKEIFQRCCLGSCIQLSATLTQKDIENGELLIMNRRYHGVNLPVPKLRLCPSYLQKWILLWTIIHQKRKWIIFVPTIQQVDFVVKFLRRFFSHVGGVSSKSVNNQEYIQNLKIYPDYILVSTTLLERGITIEDVHVIVYHCEHIVFDARTLIQISGRVGRKPNHPTGFIYFLSTSQTKGVSECIKTIQKLNHMSV